MTILDEEPRHNLPEYLRGGGLDLWGHRRLGLDLASGGLVQPGQDECPWCEGDEFKKKYIYPDSWRLTADEKEAWIKNPHLYYVRIWRCCYRLCLMGPHGHVYTDADACSNCDECMEHCYCHYCERCDGRTDEYCSECEYCNDCCSCSEICECQAPNLHFTFPVNGAEPVAQDERIHVELPKGTISDEGLNLIESWVCGALGWQNQIRVRKAIDECGPTWQTKRGNFTRRLSSALHKQGLKIEPGVLTEVGNLGRQHSSDAASWEVEFTRDLNLPAAAFVNEESCWFTDGDCRVSRCCLKNWGGLAIRTFDPDYGTSKSSSYRDVLGRAWIQPLDADLKPTHDVMNAHAYVLYNGYGDLESYSAARIVAHLTGKTYKRIWFGADDQYVNSHAGYLVSDEETCKKTDELQIGGIDPHHQYDAFRVLEGSAA